MQSSLSRRIFAARIGLAAGGLACLPAIATAIEPFKRKGLPRLRLGLAAYSFRQYFVGSTDERAREVDPAKRIDLFQFIDYCAEHGCDGAELTSYYFPPKTDQEFLLKLRRHAFLRGVAISGTAVGNTFTHPEGPKRQQEISSVKRWIENAAIMGAPHVRIFAGSKPNGINNDEARKLCISAIEECAVLAAQKGVFLGLENHGGIVAEPDGLLEIMQAVESPWVGVNLDTGNFHTEDPYRDLELCAPYAVNVQIKSEIRRRRGASEAADMARMIKILREANYQGFVALEYEAAPDPWKQVPGLLRELKKLMDQS